MNTPTETLASDLLAIADALLTGRSALSARESAARLLAQHSTLTKQDERITDLEKELEEVRGYYTSALDSCRMWRATADGYWQELEALKAEASNDEQAELAAWELLRDANKELEEIREVNACLVKAADKLEEDKEYNARLCETLRADWEAERALADRLAALAQRNRDSYGGQVVNPRCKCQDCEYLAPIDKALAAWKEARRDT